MGKFSKIYSSTQINQGITINKSIRKYRSTTSINQSIEHKYNKIKYNFKKIIRRLMAKQHKNSQIHPITFLNIVQSSQQLNSPTCMPGITSLENMMSQTLINPVQDCQSYVIQSSQSLTDPISSTLLINEPQIAIYFISLLQRVKRLISRPLTISQNQTIIKGTWNILIKYWKDNGYKLYQINQKVQWGLFQLINFKFTTDAKQRFQAEENLRIAFNQIDNFQHQNSLPSSCCSCTLEFIQT